MKHGQQVTEFGVPPLPQKNTPKKPASTSLRASCFFGWTGAGQLPTEGCPDACPALDDQPDDGSVHAFGHSGFGRGAQAVAGDGGEWDGEGVK